MSARHFGVDGCRAGWFCVGLEGGKLSGDLYPGLSSLVEATGRAGSVLVDIPVGLKAGSEGPRQCDVLARQHLGKRASSVFSAPIRELLEAGSYAEANALSRALSGKGLSKQTWNICGKIREADRLLQASDSARRRLREAHPELCFYGFNRGRPMQHAKRSQAGFEERLALLACHLPDVRPFLDDMLTRYPRSQLARDDVLDATVCALTASLPASWRRLPAKPEKDRTGLVMEILFPDFSHVWQAEEMAGLGARPGDSIA